MIAPDQLFADRFRIERLAGRGGMGAVYRARDLTTDDVVALKVLRENGDDVDGRFGREARVLAQLEHVGIVRHIAHGRSADGYPYLAMEWLAGEDLAQRLSRGPLPVGEALHVVRRAAEALAFAHQRAIVHRDIKPSNIYLAGERDGYAVKLLDFGIARMGEGTQFATGTGAMLGTPGYMAPEQARGDRGLGDPRVDVFALGAVLFECLTGRRAFDGEHVMAILAKIVFQDAPRVMEWMPDVPVAVDDLVARMMSRAPEDRPRDGAQVIAALRDAAPGSRGSLPPGGRPRAALTRGELRLVSIILSSVDRPARPSSLPLAGEADATLDTAPRVSPEARLYAVAERFSARIERLLDGSFAAAMTGTGTATDQAAIAARCALAIREELPQAKMVLATGLAPMHQRLALGETIDRAARLLNQRTSTPPSDSIHLAENSQLRPIRLDEATAGLLDTRFEIGGDATGLELCRERDPVRGSRTLLGKVTRCLGRERELSLLQGLFDECVSEPVARAVLITAPPGLGKSRLLHELLDKLAQRAAPTLLVARGDPMRTGSRFGLLAEALRREMGLAATDPLAVQQHKLRARVGRHLSGDATRAVQFLGELVGVPFADSGDVQMRAARRDPRLMRDQMCRAWEDFVAQESQAHPLVLVLDDLQWGDAPSLQFVDAALRSSSEQPFMVIALARPEVRQVFPELWAARGVSEVRLGELTRKASEKLVREVLGDAVDPAAVDRITRQAGGNAFYLEELIRAVAAGNEGKLPDTVMAMAQARIESLDPDARRLLRAASVFGQVFWIDGVVELLGRSEAGAALEERIEALCQNEFFAAHTATRFADTRELGFRHALVREAVYGTLTEEDRALGHKLAAQWLSSAGENDPAVLAEHFYRGADLAHAALWYQRASELALDANDVAAARAAADKGIGCANAVAGIDPGVVGRLYLAQASCLVSHGELSAAATCVEEAIARLAVGDEAWFRAVTEWIVLSGRKANLTDLRRSIAVSAADASGPEAESARIACWCRGVTALLIAGCFEEAGELRERVEAVAPSVDSTDAGTMAQIHRARAFHHLYGGDLGAAISSFESAVVALEQASDERAACLIRCNLGFAHKSIGNYHEAESVLRLSLCAAERMGLRDVGTAVMHNLGMVLALLGRLEEGRAIESRAAEQCRAQGDPRLEGGSRCYLSAIALLSGDLVAAEREAREAVRLLEVSKPTQVSAYAALAHALLAQNRAEEAHDAAQCGMSLLNALVRVEDGEASLRLAFAESLRRCGRDSEAQSASRDAIARLSARAATIRDERWRRTFLENVAENARTLALLPNGVTASTCARTA